MWFLQKKIVILFSMSILVGVQKKKKSKEKKCVEAFVLVVNFTGADDMASRWGDVSIVPMSALEDTPTSYLRTFQGLFASDLHWICI